MKIQGLTRCTKFTPAKEKLEANKILGPDTGWKLLSDAAVQAFCNGEGRNLVHRGRSYYDHVCAAYGSWAFDAEDSSHIRTVVFIHYKTPSKAAAMLGGVDSGAGTKVFNFTGKQLFDTYSHLKKTEGEVHVWQRPLHGEIAIDFCLHDGKQIPNSAPRIQLPGFIPGKG